MNGQDTQTVALVIAGPTASGKSELALAAAQAVSGTVINADSMQVYRELRVLTARPAPADEARIPHRLYGAMPAAAPCSAGGWLRLARSEIVAARGAGRVPIVVGGSGLYLKALLEGLAPIPEIPPEIRAEARDLFERLGAAGFRSELEKLDPESAARLAPGDRQRLQRCYEVVRATGVPVGAWQRQQRREPGSEPAWAVLVLMPPRKALYGSIDARFDRMIAAGAVEEVRALLALDLDPRLPAMKAVGVQQLAAYLRGEQELAAACAAAKTASRNYAKRQVTWLRHQLLADERIHEQFSERIWPQIRSFIRRILLTSDPSGTKWSCVGPA